VREVTATIYNTRWRVYKKNVFGWQYVLYFLYCFQKKYIAFGTKALL